MKEIVNFEYKLFDFVKEYVNNGDNIDTLKNNLSELLKQYHSFILLRENSNDKEEVIELSRAINSYEYTLAILEILKKKQKCEFLEHTILENKEFELIKKIIEILYLNPGIRHNDLVLNLKVDNDTLTKCIKEIYNYRIVSKINDNTENTVKYYLTNKGIKLYLSFFYNKENKKYGEKASFY